MACDKIKMLLIEDDRGDVEPIRIALDIQPEADFLLETEEDLSNVMERVAHGDLTVDIPSEK
jgi:hypothetical protein